MFPSTHTLHFVKLAVIFFLYCKTSTLGVFLIGSAVRVEATSYSLKFTLMVNVCLFVPSSFTCCFFLTPEAVVSSLGCGGMVAGLLVNSYRWRRSPASPLLAACDIMDLLFVALLLTDSFYF